MIKITVERDLLFKEGALYAVKIQCDDIMVTFTGLLECMRDGASRRYTDDSGLIIDVVGSMIHINMDGMINIQYCKDLGDKLEYVIDCLDRACETD